MNSWTYNENTREWDPNLAETASTSYIFPSLDCRKMKKKKRDPFGGFYWMANNPAFDFLKDEPGDLYP